MEKARRRARLIILEQIREEDYQKAKTTFAEKASTREKELSALHDRLIADYGTATTKWENLWDAVQNLDVFYHTESKETVYGEVAICEKCDSRVLNEDVRCVKCQAPRSAKNKKLYRRLG